MDESMFFYKDGRPVHSEIGQILAMRKNLQVLWSAPDAFGRRSIKDKRIGELREFKLGLEKMTVLASTVESTGSGQERWMEYNVIAQAALQTAHPQCAVCHGTGIGTILEFDSRTDFVCRCVTSPVLLAIDIECGLVEEVRLDRWEVVVTTIPVNPTPDDKEQIQEVLGKHLTSDAAAIEATALRNNERFQPGSTHYEGRVVVGVQIREIPLPPWVVV